MATMQQGVFNEFVLNKWDKRVPIEKSAYLQSDNITYFNVEEFSPTRGTLNMLDLFCGAGGFSVGCEWAGFRPVFGVDHFEPAVRTWVKNHPHAIGCLGDIKKLDARELKTMLDQKGVHKVHLITGGVPCQGFSRANRKHIDHDERNYLFLEYMKFVEVFQPDYIILENVSGMRTTAGGIFEKEIKSSMEDMGYSVTVKLVNAADYGVPQVRKRLIFVGVKQERGLVNSYVFPMGEYQASPLTVEAALSDLPPLGNNESANYYRSSPQNDFQKLMRGEGCISHIKKSYTLYNHLSPNHPPETIEKIRSTPQGEAMYSRFKQRIRLKLDAPSPTQLAGGIRPQFQFGHPTQPRGLTIRERARIQSFPDCYEFLGGMVQERVQTGNAVPPLLIYNLVVPIVQDIERRGI